MSKSKKAVIFLVEGVFDKIALETVLAQIIESKEVYVHITYGDITTRFDITSQNIKKELNAVVKSAMKQRGFQQKDILSIIHLVDTDGAFILPELVVYDDGAEEVDYCESSIRTKNRDAIVERNQKKANLLNLLAGMDHLDHMKYEIYYMSCNLEHVLHDRLDRLGREEKQRLAEDFEDSYGNDPKGFLDFISSPEIAAGVDYQDSWAYIKEGCHSLERNCNLHHFLKSEG